MSDTPNGSEPVMDGATVNQAGAPEQGSEGAAPQPPAYACAVLLVMPHDGGAIQINVQPIRNVARSASRTDVRGMCAEMVSRIAADDMIEAMQMRAQMEQELALREQISGVDNGRNGGGSGLMSYLRGLAGKRGRR